ncbi:hypothetical protein Ancab_038285 [Ancistrocladus abbreviatus]
MAEEEQVSVSVIASDIESKVRAALISRVPYLREQADSLTFEGVRRVLEKDLGLETHALDAHKRFVRNCLQEGCAFHHKLILLEVHQIWRWFGVDHLSYIIWCLEAGNDDQISKNSDDAAQKVVSSTEGEEFESVEGFQPKKEAKESNIADGEVMEDSPVFGLMTGDKNVKNESKESQDTEYNAGPNEVTIKNAIKKRASYLKEKSENITLAGVRRLLEEDLKLEKYSLDAFKKIVTEQVNEILISPEISKRPSEKKANIKKTNANVASTKSRKWESSGQSGSDSDEVGDDDIKNRKKTTQKRKLQNSEGPKKRKKVEEDTKELGRKQTKASKTKSEVNSDEEDGGSVSEEDKSESSAEKPVKLQKKEAPKAPYGKRVEHLKSVIKSCGMSVPPSIYKKVKQAPENKREASLIKELEEILSKEGLSTDPTEKEIKEVKKRKDRAKELEGIDLSNIVTSSRRRSTTSFAPPPKPKTPVDSDTQSGDNDDDEEEEEDNDDEQQVNKEDGGEGSQSEEDDEDNDDDSD